MLCEHAPYQQHFIVFEIEVVRIIIMITIIIITTIIILITITIIAIIIIIITILIIIIIIIIIIIQDFRIYMVHIYPHIKMFKTHVLLLPQL